MFEKVKNILKETGAFLEGHFLLSSGRHSKEYVQCARLLEYPDKSQEVLEVVADKVKNIDFDIVVGPAMGGIIVAYELAKQTGKRAMFTERVDGVMTLRRGFEIKPGDKVLISEDVVTTGKSSMETVEVIKNCGGSVVGIACIVDRSTVDISLPVYSAIKLNIETYEADKCPMCSSGIPYVKPGSRNIK